MFQISLRTVLGLVALVALAIVSLRHASAGWQWTAAAVGLATFAAAGVAGVVARGPRRAFAAGCALSMLAYGVLLWSAGPHWGGSIEQHPEFNPGAGRLPTTRLLGPLYRSVAEVRFVNFRTGEVVRPVEEHAVDAAYVTLSEWPRRRTFATIGHWWWSVLIGLAGGVVVRLVYGWRKPETARC